MGFLPFFFLLVIVWNPSSEEQKGIEDPVLFIEKIKPWSPGLRWEAKDVDLVVMPRGWEKDVSCSWGSSLSAGTSWILVGDEDIGGWLK